MQVNAAPAVPVPEVIVKLMEAVLPVIALPTASCTVTTGCCANAVPLLAEMLGWVVNTTLAARPAEMSKLLLMALVRPAVVAVSVYPVPALSILQPAKVATPAVAASGFAVQVNAAPGVRFRSYRREVKSDAVGHKCSSIGS